MQLRGLRCVLGSVGAELRRAFSLAPARPALDDDDRALLDQVAAAVRRRRLAVPAVLWLESIRPLHFLGSQLMVALRPIAHAVLPPDRYDRFTAILERRDGIEELLKRIEAEPTLRSGTEPTLRSGTEPGP